MNHDTSLEKAAGFKAMRLMHGNKPRHQNRLARVSPAKGLLALLNTERNRNERPAYNHGEKTQVGY
mgnify:CR=1 FL=1